MIRLNSRGADETMEIGKRIGEKLNPGDAIALRGGLGAGKTTLTKGIAAGLDIAEEITSPTFTLVAEYTGRLALYHMDVYRLDGAEDFFSLGAEETLYGGGVCVIEWSEKIADSLPETAIIISLAAEKDGMRTITIENWPYGEIL